MRVTSRQTKNKQAQRSDFLQSKFCMNFFFSYLPPPGLLPVLGLLEWYMTPTLDAALLCSSWFSFDLGCTSDWLRSFVNWVSSFPSILSRGGWANVQLIICTMLQGGYKNIVTQCSAELTIEIELK